MRGVPTGPVRPRKMPLPRSLMASEWLGYYRHGAPAGAFQVVARDKILRCRINAAFRTSPERRIHTAGRRPQKKSVVRPRACFLWQAYRETLLFLKA